MFLRIVIFLVGFGFTIVGCMYIICYLNLLTIGYNFLEYVNFICRKIECIISLIGIILMAIAIGGKNELHI